MVAISIVVVIIVSTVVSSAAVVAPAAATSAPTASTSAVAPVRRDAERFRVELALGRSRDPLALRVVCLAGDVVEEGARLIVVRFGGVFFDLSALQFFWLLIVLFVFLTIKIHSFKFCELYQSRFRLY